MTLIIVPPAAIAPGVYQTFTDATLADLVATAGDSEPAEATFEFGLDFAQVDNRLTSVDLTMRLAINMPEWSNAGSRPAAERNEWARFLRALRYHEDGHIDIFRREAPVTYKKLTASTPGKINEVLGAEKRRIQRLSDQYDTATGHGTKQQTPDGTTVITVP